jgi:hypothetical protein
MPITITITEWEIPAGNDCQFNDGKPCPLLKAWEFASSAYCAIERYTPLDQSKRQTWKKTPLCRLRG